MSFSSVIDLNLPSGCSHGAKISFADSLDNSWHVAGSSGSNANEIVAHRIFHKHRGKLTNLPTITPVGHLSVFDLMVRHCEVQSDEAIHADMPASCVIAQVHDGIGLAHVIPASEPESLCYVIPGACPRLTGMTRNLLALCHPERSVSGVEGSSEVYA